MPALVTGSGATATQLHMAYLGLAPSNATYQAIAGLIDGSTDSAIALQIGEITAGIPSAQLAASVLANLGISAATTNADAFAALSTALVQVFDAYPGAQRGQVVLNLIKILPTLESDATYGVAAANFNKATYAAYTYASNPANTTTAAVGSSFWLTTAVDTIAGTAGADVITAVVSTLSSEGTLQVTDAVDGGEGADTLFMDLKAAFAGFTTGSVKNVETIDATNAGTIDRTVSTKGITGATTYNLHSTGAAISLTDLAAAGIAVNVHGQAKGAVSVGFTAAALTGTADALTLGLNNVGTAEVKAATGVTPVAEQVVAVSTTAGVESVAINATGANFVSLAGADAAKFTVAGAGTLKVTAVGAGLTSFDASAATGAITADLTAATGAGAITAVKGGAGNDAFTVDAADLAANVTLDGGAGTNTLTIKGGSGTLQPVMTGFQTLGLNTLSGAVVLSGTNASGLNTISLAGANALSGFDLTVANLTATDLTVKSTGAQSAANVILTPATNLTYTTAASATATAAKTAETVATAITAADATAATINVGAYTSQTGAINVAKATTVTLNVASGKDTAGTTELTNFNATLNAAKATSLTVNATGKLAASTFNVGAATTVALTATAGSSGTVDVNAAKATNVSITAGAALDLTGSDFASAEQVTIVANKGAVSGTVVLAKVNGLTLSGADGTSAVTLGKLGTDAQEYAVNVTATGLKGGLTLGGAETKAAVSIDVSGMTGTSSLGALVGDTVTVNATGALGAVSNGGITAKSAATYNGTELKANTATITAGTGSTALTAVLKGGIDNDTYTVNSVATSTSTTVSGDVGIGTNSVTIDGSLAAVAAGFTLDASGLTGAGTTTITLTGSSTVKNTITGSAVADTITGGAASDTLNGGAGNDTINGGNMTQAAAAVTAVTEVATMTALAAGLTAGQTYTLAGLTYTSTGVTTQAQLAGAFASLAAGATTGAGTATGTYTGTLTGYSTSAAVGNVVTFTATAAGSVADLTDAGTGAAAADVLVTTQGVTAAAAIAQSVDTFTGGAGNDRFDFSTADVDTTTGVITATITDFVSGTDTIKVTNGGAGVGDGTTYLEAGAAAASLAALLTAADTALNGTVQYYVGQVGSDSYLVTDADGNGYTNVVKLTGVALTGIAAADLVA